MNWYVALVNDSLDNVTVETIALTGNHLVNSIIMRPYGTAVVVSRPYITKEQAEIGAKAYLEGKKVIISSVY